MKKRVLAVLMILVMVFATAMSVSAAGSITDPIEPSKPGDYEVTTESPNFNVTADVKTTIEKMNKGEETNLPALSGKKIIQKFFEIEAVDNHDKCEDAGVHTVTLNVSGVKNCKNIVVVHYSTQKQAWEYFSEADNTLTVDRSKGTVTFQVRYSDLDHTPFAIYAEVSGSGEAGSGTGTGTGAVVGTSPATQGVSSTWMLFAAMALVVLGSGVVVYQKKRG